MILGVAGGLPECSSYVVLEGDQGGYSAGATATQMLLTGPRQRDPNALPPMPFANGEPIHVSSPSVPASNQGADNLIAALSNQKSRRGISDQALDVIQAIGRSCVLAPRLSPKLQDRSRVLVPASTYRDSLASQVGSMASQCSPSGVFCCGER